MSLFQLHRTAISSMNSTSTSYCPKTAFTKKHVISEAQSVIFVSFLGILVPVTIAANSLLAFALIKTKQLVKSVSNVFIFLLCLSDIFLGSVTITLDIIIFTKYRLGRFCTLELAGTFIQQFSTHMSVNIIFVIALHRYIQVNPDFKEITGFKRRLTSRTGSIVLVFLAFLLAIVHGLLSTYCFASYKNRIPNWIIKGTDCILIITFYVLYIRLFWRIRQHTQANKALWSAENRVVLQEYRRVENHRPKYLGKLTKTVFFILIAIGICYLPFIIVDIYTAWMGDVEGSSTAQTIRFLYFMSWGIAFINSTINAVIIFYRNDKLKEFFNDRVLNCSWLFRDL